jgi:uncharacterized protein YndB with AHSA1/START domain
MPDIFHSFTINASPGKVFDCISESRGLDNWWTEHSEGKQESVSTYKLDFGPGFIWKAVVTKFQLNNSFEFQMTSADAGWPENNEHYRISCYCSAMYLRILKRFIEFGEKVPYGKRLSV